MTIAIAASEFLDPKNDVAILRKYLARDGQQKHFDPLCQRYIGLQRGERDTER